MSFQSSVKNKVELKIMKQLLCTEAKAFFNRCKEEIDALDISIKTLKNNKECGIWDLDESIVNISAVEC